MPPMFSPMLLRVDAPLVSVRERLGALSREVDLLVPVSPSDSVVAVVVYRG